ncbi:hypothetical protein SYNPS1DRAFT_21960 [Syncephalis pseudoplumigaleata]|uniref:MARVEL domain-containing protein n=1 Tax=Syncephalis pseudoplumigaleata TaxID=1712513 RepID=A0A4P9Z171_9FUNG|nr:hypothetical protein SYNPS1DRAFT_21960 [Syncephalis pseudoplumigaleata]|eukprot:RKP26233.1 hypothetical protein SYNPS1DRAFT_21960 [Syncephalis pseudoplumigaleata]
MELPYIIFTVRLAQVICAFLAMALSARVIDLYRRHSADGSESAFNFSLFTSLTGCALSGLMLGAPFLYNRLRWTWTRFLVDPFGETMSSIIYIVFFFVSGVVVALKAAPDAGGCGAQHFGHLVEHGDDGSMAVASDDAGPGACRTAKATAAFDFFALLTWLGTFALLVYSHRSRLRVLFVPGAAAAQADLLTQNATMASMSPASQLPPTLPSRPTTEHSGASNKTGEENRPVAAVMAHASPYAQASSAISDSMLGGHGSPSNGPAPPTAAATTTASLAHMPMPMPMPEPAITTSHAYTAAPGFPMPMTAALTQQDAMQHGSPSLSIPEPSSTAQSSPVLLATNPPSPIFPSPHSIQHRRQFSGEGRSIMTSAPSMVASYDPSAYTGRTAHTTYTRTVTPPTTLQDDRSVYPASTDAIYHGSSRATDSILSREALSVPSIRSKEEEENEMGSLYPASTDGLYQGSSRAPSLPDDVKEEEEEEAAAAALSSS